jgi:predicted CXXCH cytochrome family protein
MLPFAYWITIGQWLPKAFFDPDGPETLEDGVPLVEGIDHVRDVRPFNQVCMNCHNTFAYSYRIFHPMFVGFPAATVSAALGPLSAALSVTTPVAPRVADFEKLNGRLDPETHLVTTGISCESCHLGGREHAVLGKPIRFAPTSPLLKLTPHDPARPVTGERRDAPSVNGVCTQCHSGNARFYPNGAAECNSREAFDFLSGSCSSKLTCVKCHDPHVTGPPSGGPTRPEHVDLCIGCHRQYEQPAAALAHSRHGIDVNCLDCHMPRQTLGLDELVRTHRIAAPVEQSMIDRGSANACNLCHLDRSLRWTLTELEKGWGRVLSGQMAGDLLDRPAGETWLGSEQQSLRVLATQSFARSPLGKGRLPDLLEALNDAEPINRVFALKAVERVRGRKVSAGEYSLTAPPAVRREQIDGLQAKLSMGASCP